MKYYNAIKKSETKFKIFNVLWILSNISVVVWTVIILINVLDSNKKEEMFKECSQYNILICFIIYGFFIIIKTVLDLYDKKTNYAH